MIEDTFRRRFMAAVTGVAATAASQSASASTEPENEFEWERISTPMYEECYTKRGEGVTRDLLDSVVDLLADHYTGWTADFNHGNVVGFSVETHGPINLYVDRSSTDEVDVVHPVGPHHGSEHSLGMFYDDSNTAVLELLSERDSDVPMKLVQSVRIMLGTPFEVSAIESLDHRSQ